MSERLTVEQVIEELKRRCDECHGQFKRTANQYTLGMADANDLAEQLVAAHLVPQWLDEPTHAKDGSGEYYWLRKKRICCLVWFDANRNAWMWRASDTLAVRLEEQVAPATGLPPG